ncbi:MAG: aldose 1-epimerase [Burkholderiaceae bacterium]
MKSSLPQIGLNRETVILDTGVHRLALLPGLGGSIASWEMTIGNQRESILRPWDGAAPDAYTYACFPLVPWSNRISGGGFTHAGIFYPMQLNRAGENYPIHGDGWLQPWSAVERTPESITLQLTSDRFSGNPYRYRASQRFMFASNRLCITFSVTHEGNDPLPYGLGLHPYFPRNAATRLQMQCTGMWVSGPDPMPIAHTDRLPRTFDYRSPASLDGPMIDNCFSGWDGRAVISYPDRGLAIDLEMGDCRGYALMYRPPSLDYFCLEPITHPIDAFHMPGRPGLQVLHKGESLRLDLTLAVRAF